MNCHPERSRRISNIPLHVLALVILAGALPLRAAPLPSLPSLPSLPHRPLRAGCLIYAAEYQQALYARHLLPFCKTRLLSIHYHAPGYLDCLHVYCLFRLRGIVFAYAHPEGTLDGLPQSQRWDNPLSAARAIAAAERRCLRPLPDRARALDAHWLTPGQL